MKHSQIIIAFIAFCLCMPFFTAWGQTGNYDSAQNIELCDSALETLDEALQGREDLSLFNPMERSVKSLELGIGGMNRLDTYLSPQDYRGTEVRLIFDKIHRGGNNCDYQFTHEVSFDYTKNKVKNAHTMAGHYDFAFGMMYRWRHLINGNLSLSVGGMADVFLGFAYNMRNSSNNPAQAYASLAIGLSGIAKYSLHLWHKTFPITYEARLPFCGLMFSPAYGQSYYELFCEGNYDHNIVFTSIATPSFRQQLTVDIPVKNSKKGQTFIRVGYLSDIRQAKPNCLRQHAYTNSFIIGLTRTIN